MDILLQTIINNIVAYDWNSPFTLVFILLASLALMRRWGMFMILTVTILLGIGGANLIIMNASTAELIVTVPNAVYAIGAGALAIGSLLAYIKFTLS